MSFGKGVKRFVRSNYKIILRCLLGVILLTAGAYVIFTLNRVF